MAKKNQENPLEELEKAYAQWQRLYENGGSDPFWPDGVNLNLVRNHIIYYKGQIKETCPLYMADEIYLRDLPPEVDQNYMANTDKIREQARQSLGAYLADPNYQYLLRHRDSLSPKQSKELCVGAVLGYVAGLQKSIAQDNLVEMRRHREPERYLESFRDCAERVWQALESAEPMEAISCFKEKIASNWQAYREKLLALPKEVLIDRAEEIAAVKLSREVLTSPSLSRNDLDYLDRFSDPLQVVAESWLSEQDGDQSAALDHALWELRDRQDAEQEYELGQTM